MNNNKTAKQNKKRILTKVMATVMVMATAMVVVVESLTPPLPPLMMTMAKVVMVPR